MNNQDYTLHKNVEETQSYGVRLLRNIKEIAVYINKKAFFISISLAVLSSAAEVITPYLLGRAIDTYVTAKDLDGLLTLIAILGGIYLIGAVATYYQQMIMGKASQQALYHIRGGIFEKIQSLPLAFFGVNKTGDLMSRINNDTDKLSQFLSESILRFTGSIFTILGIGIFVLTLNFKLGLALLSFTLLLLVVTRILSPLLEKANKRSQSALGGFTAGASEQLTNFKAIIAFDRRNFFEDFLSGLNTKVYNESRLSGFLNQIFVPIFDFAGYLAQALVLVYGIFLISQGELTIGLLISFVVYTQRFYDPLRYLADILGEMQISLAAWGRIREILSLESNLKVIRNIESENEKINTQLGKESENLKNSTLVESDNAESMTSKHFRMEFRNVSFGYQEKTEVLENISFILEQGKTYALVGPTGGGKSTIATLLTRLYDPTQGTVVWKGKDIRSYAQQELSSDISVILQEPYLFTGTVGENIRYGNSNLEQIDEKDFVTLLSKKGMDTLLKKLPEGLETKVESGGENISIGQKQLISFVRTILREPKLIILDEATANIDTLTEATLQQLIESLPQETIKVIIAHRLNTIKEADEILFVAGRGVKQVADENEVLELLKSASKT